MKGWPRARAVLIEHDKTVGVRDESLAECDKSFCTLDKAGHLVQQPWPSHMTKGWSCMITDWMRAMKVCRIFESVQKNSDGGACRNEPFVLENTRRLDLCSRRMERCGRFEVVDMEGTGYRPLRVSI